MRASPPSVDRGDPHAEGASVTREQYGAATILPGLVDEAEGAAVDGLSSSCGTASSTDGSAGDASTGTLGAEWHAAAAVRRLSGAWSYGGA
jgi:hypothetical protein